MPLHDNYVSFSAMAKESSTRIDHAVDPTDALFLRVFRADHIMIGSNWRHDAVLSPYWRLYVNDREGAKVVWAGGEHPILPGRVHMIPSGIMFDCRCSRRVSHFYVHFDLIGLPLPALVGLFDRPIGFVAERGLSALLEALIKSWAPGSPVPGGLAGAARLKAATYQALGQVIGALSPPQYQRLLRWTDGRDPTGPAVRYIEEHLGEPIDNAQLAKMCHMSPDHFIRRFRQFTGRPPAKYIMDRRINHASQRLLLTDDSIDRIAEASGFPDRFYFSRVFKNRTLTSPAAYRKAGGI